MSFKKSSHDSYKSTHLVELKICAEPTGEPGERENPKLLAFGGFKVYLLVYYSDLWKL